MSTLQSKPYLEHLASNPAPMNVFSKIIIFPLQVIVLSLLVHSSLPLPPVLEPTVRLCESTRQQATAKVFRSLQHFVSPCLDLLDIQVDGRPEISPLLIGGS